MYVIPKYIKKKRESKINQIQENQPGSKGSFARFQCLYGNFHVERFVSLIPLMFPYFFFIFQYFQFCYKDKSMSFNFCSNVSDYTNHITFSSRLWLKRLESFPVIFYFQINTETKLCEKKKLYLTWLRLKISPNCTTLVQYCVITCHDEANSCCLKPQGKW